MAATEGIVGSPGFGRIPFAHSAAILPGVSMPSSVVRSMHRIARSSAHSLEAFLIERLAREAARSSAPTWSTLRTPRMREPRCERESAVAMWGLCDGGLWRKAGAPRAFYQLTLQRRDWAGHRGRPTFTRHVSPIPGPRPVLP